MSPRKARAVPDRLEKVRQRFERWRQTRKIPARIPWRLWVAAARMAREYGIAQTAKALRLNSSELKKRIEHDAVVRPPVGQDRPVATFLELASPALNGSCRCTVELENVIGAKMRIDVQGGGAPDLVALSRSFWNPEP